MHVRLSSYFAVFNFMVVIIAFTASSAFAVTGSDISPGAVCSVEDSVMTTANPGGTGGYVLTCESGTWKATVSGETPTANEHLATKEYVDTAVAAAGGGLPIATQYNFTASTYNGSFGASRCSTDFGAGWRTGSTIDLYYFHAQGLFPIPSAKAWITALPDNQNISEDSMYPGLGFVAVALFSSSVNEGSQNCRGWSTSNSSTHGSFLSSSSVTFNGNTYNGCNNSQLVFCVK